MIKSTKVWLFQIATFGLVAGVVFFAWQALQPEGLPEGFVASNGRIEAVEIDVATKIPGRIRDILVNEGEFVSAGQLLARMDTAALNAQLREAEAHFQRALIGVEIAQNQVTQRNAEKDAAQAVVAQRRAEMDAAQKRLARTKELAAKGTAPIQRLDDHFAQFQGNKAGLSAAQAKLAAADAAIGVARSQGIATRSEVEAARATIQRIQVEIDDSSLQSPRDGRVQYLVAQPGEVRNAGGKVLNLVDLGDVYMTFFLPTGATGRVALGAEVRLVLDAVPQYVVPAEISFVADVAQFTPKTVETADERQKLMFRIKARIHPDLLKKHLHQVKTGLPGMAYVRLNQQAEWPQKLKVRLPQ